MTDGLIWYANNITSSIQYNCLNDWWYCPETSFNNHCRCWLDLDSWWYILIYRCLSLMGRPAWAPSVRWGRQASKPGNPESCNLFTIQQKTKRYIEIKIIKNTSQIFKKLIRVKATFEIHLILEAGPGADGRQLISLIPNASIKSFSSFQPGIRQVKAHIVLSLYSNNFQRA